MPETEIPQTDGKPATTVLAGMRRQLVHIDRQVVFRRCERVESAGGDAASFQICADSSRACLLRFSPLRRLQGYVDSCGKQTEVRKKRQGQV